MRILETTCAISILGLCAALQPVLQGRPERKPTPESPTRAPMDAVVDEMQGAWRLTKMDSPVLDVQNRQDVGFLLVAGNYFSFELHFGWVAPHGQSTQRAFTSGTHRFEIDERSRMVARSVIGSAIDDQGRILFEQPGRQREYAVDCSSGFMKLTRDDGTKFEFERMVDTKPKRDFYGRPIKPKPAGEDAKTGGETPPKKD